MAEVELEQKYLIADPRPLPQLEREIRNALRTKGCLVGLGSEGAQTDTYYDTPDDAVLKAGCSLRVRQKGRASMLTWKTPAAAAGTAFARNEREESIASPAAAKSQIAAFFAACLADLPEGSGKALAPVAVVENLRRCYRVTLGSEQYELALDSAIYRTPQNDRQHRERQLELERKRGEGAALPELAAALEAACPWLQSAGGSKYDRARKFLR
ncbi:MAG: CYTH domain-containing protein [Pseudoflavonifractor sp.]